METKFFNDQDDFLDHIDDIATKTLPWEQQPTTELKLEGTVNGMIFHSNDGHVYALRDCCLRSLRQRLCSEADLVTKTSNESIDANGNVAEATQMFADYVSWAKKVLKHYGHKENTKVSVVDGKVNAFLSTEYVEALDTKYVHDQAFKQICETTGSTDFGFKGWWNYAMSMAEYTTNKQLTLGGNAYKTVIRVRTSDAGYSSIGLGTGLVRNGKFIPLMSDIDIPHRGSKNATVMEHRVKFENDFSEALNEMDKVVNQATVKIQDLINIKITHLEGCALSLAKAIGLPKPEVKKAVAQSSIIGDSAWYVYLKLCEIFDDSWDAEKRIKQSGNLAKILGIKDWKKYDIEFSWK